MSLEGTKPCESFGLRADKLGQTACGFRTKSFPTFVKHNLTIIVNNFRQHNPLENAKKKNNGFNFRNMPFSKGHVNIYYF